MPVTYNGDSFILTPVTKKEVINVITKLKNKKSTGLDKLSVDIIKHIKESIAEPIRYLTMLIFYTGVYPNELKIGLVAPIHKKSDPTLVSNYRPITLVSIISKIIEKFFYDRFIQFLGEH